MARTITPPQVTGSTAAASLAAPADQRAPSISANGARDAEHDREGARGARDGGGEGGAGDQRRDDVAGIGGD